MERLNHSTVITLFWDQRLAPGEIRLDGAPAQHAHVRRIRRGDPVRLVDGWGRVASATALEITKKQVTVSVERVIEVTRPLDLEVIVPVADRERMLLAAEKCVELQVTAWRPAYFARSRSVSPRGEGAKFRDKVKARMQSALEQSGGAWLPDMHEEVEAVDAMTSVAATWTRVVLDSRGDPLPRLVSNAATVVAVGPEGGLEPHELTAARNGGWTLASLGATTLRFETAVIAAAAVIRATQLSPRSS